MIEETKARLRQADEYSPEILPHIATQKRSWVADVPYDYMLIQLGDTFIKSAQTSHQLFGVEFIQLKNGKPKSVEGPALLQGTYTSRLTLHQAIRDYAEKKGLPFKYEIVTEDGQTVIGINPRAI